MDYEIHTDIKENMSSEMIACLSLITNVEYFGKKDHFIPTEVSDFFKLQHILSKLQGNNLAQNIFKFLDFVKDERIININSTTELSFNMLNRFINYTNIAEEIYLDITNLVTYTTYTRIIGQTKKNKNEMINEVTQNMLIKMISDEITKHNLITSRIVPVQQNGITNLLFCNEFSDNIYLVYINDDEKCFESIVIYMTNDTIQNYEKIKIPYFVFQARIAYYFIKKIYEELDNDSSENDKPERRKIVCETIKNSVFNITEPLLYFFGNDYERNTIVSQFNFGEDIASILFSYFKESKGNNVELLKYFTQITERNSDIKDEIFRYQEYIGHEHPIIPISETNSGDIMLSEQQNVDYHNNLLNNQRNLTKYMENDNLVSPEVYINYPSVHQILNDIKINDIVYLNCLNEISEKHSNNEITKNDVRSADAYLRKCSKILSEYYTNNKDEIINSNLKQIYLNEIKRALEKIYELMIIIEKNNNNDKLKEIFRAIKNEIIYLHDKNNPLISKLYDEVIKENKKIEKYLTANDNSPYFYNPIQKYQLHKNPTFFVERIFVGDPRNGNFFYSGYVNKLINDNINYAKNYINEKIKINIVRNVNITKAYVFSQECLNERLNENPDSSDNFLDYEYKSFFTKLLLTTGILLENTNIFHSKEKITFSDATQVISKLILSNDDTYYENYKYVISNLADKYFKKLNGYFVESLFTYIKNKFALKHESNKMIILEEINNLFYSLVKSYYSSSKISFEPNNNNEFFPQKSVNVSNQTNMLNIDSAIAETEKITSTQDETTQGDKLTTTNKIISLIQILEGDIDTSNELSTKLLINIKASDLQTILDEDKVYKRMINYVRQITGELYQFSSNDIKSEKQTALFFLFGNIMLESPIYLLKSVLTDLDQNECFTLFDDDMSAEENRNDNIKFHRFVLIKIFGEMAKLWLITFSKNNLIYLYRHAFIILYNILLKKYFPKYYDKCPKVSGNEYITKFMSDVNKIPIHNEIELSNIKYIKNIIETNDGKIICDIVIDFPKVFDENYYKFIQDDIDKIVVTVKAGKRPVYLTENFSKYDTFLYFLFGKKKYNTSNSKELIELSKELDKYNKENINDVSVLRELVNVRIKSILASSKNKGLTINNLCDNQNFSNHIGTINVDNNYGFKYDDFVGTKFITKRLLDKETEKKIDKYKKSGEEFSIKKKKYKFDKDENKFYMLTGNEDRPLESIKESKIMQLIEKYKILKNYVGDYIDDDAISGFTIEGMKFVLSQNIDLFGMFNVEINNNSIFLIPKRINSDDLPNVKFGDNGGLYLHLGNKPQNSESTYYFDLETSNFFELMTMDNIETSYEYDKLIYNLNDEINKSLENNKKISFKKFKIDKNDNDEPFKFYSELFNINAQPLIHYCNLDVKKPQENIHIFSDSYMFTERYLETKLDYVINFIKYVSSGDENYINVSNNYITFPYMRYGYVFPNKDNNKPYNYKVANNDSNPTNNTLYDILLNNKFANDLNIFLRQVGTSNVVSKIEQLDDINLYNFIIMTSYVVGLRSDHSDLVDAYSNFVVHIIKSNRLMGIATLKEIYGTITEDKQSIYHNVVCSCMASLLCEIHRINLYNGMMRKLGDLKTQKGGAKKSCTKNKNQKEQQKHEIVTSGLNVEIRQLEQKIKNIGEAMDIAELFSIYTFPSVFMGNKQNVDFINYGLHKMMFQDISTRFSEIVIQNKSINDSTFKSIRRKAEIEEKLKENHITYKNEYSRYVPNYDKCTVRRIYLNYIAGLEYATYNVDTDKYLNTDTDNFLLMTTMGTSNQKYIQLDQLFKYHDKGEYLVLPLKNTYIDVPEEITIGNCKYNNFIRGNNFVLIKSNKSSLKIPFFVNDLYLIQCYSWDGKELVDDTKLKTFVKFTGTSLLDKKEIILRIGLQDKKITWKTYEYIRFLDSIKGKDDKFNNLCLFLLNISPHSQLGVWKKKNINDYVIDIDRYKLSIHIDENGNKTLHDVKEGVNYEIVDIIENSNISRWVGRNTKNILLTKHKLLGYFIFVFGYVNIDENSLNGYKLRIKKYSDSYDKYYTKLGINLATNLPMIDTKMDMLLLLNSYLIGNEMQNILELYKIYYSLFSNNIKTRQEIVDFSDKYYEIEYAKLLDHNIGNINKKINLGSNKQILFQYKQCKLADITNSVMSRNFGYQFDNYKISSKEYYHDYVVDKNYMKKVMNDIESNVETNYLDELIKLYYCNNYEHNRKILFPTIADFYLYLLYYENPKVNGIDIKDYAFNIYFAQILLNCSKSEIKKVKDYYTDFTKYFNDNVNNFIYFRTNPFEMIYQLVTGLIASDDQNSLANTIFFNTFKYNINKYINLNDPQKIGLNSTNDEFTDRFLLIRDINDNLQEIGISTCHYDEPINIREYSDNNDYLYKPIQQSNVMTNEEIDMNSIVSNITEETNTRLREQELLKRQTQQSQKTERYQRQQPYERNDKGGRGSQGRGRPQGRGQGRGQGKDMYGGNYNINKTMRGLQYGDEIVQCNSRIYNLIMGGGKTSMITPLIVLKFVQFMIDKSPENIYIVMPKHLVQQSYNLFVKNIPSYFPITIQKLEEEGRENGKKEYTNSLDENTKSKNIMVYIMSDLTMKCGFLNKFGKIRENAKNHMYLFDEVDTVINPITSGLNYPVKGVVGEQNNEFGIRELEYCFDIIFDILHEIYKSEDILNKTMEQYKGLLPNYDNSLTNSQNLYKFFNSAESLEQNTESYKALNKLYEDTKIVYIYDQYKNQYISEPHFNVVSQDSPLIQKIQEYVVDRLKKYYKQNQQIIKNLDLCFGHDDCVYSVNEISEENKKILYILYNFINISIPTCVYFINRKDYGVYHHTIIKEIDKKLGKIVGMNHCVIPFTYSEKPSVGSQFSNPILVACLTIVNYIVRINKSEIFEIYDKNVINEIERLQGKPYVGPKTSCDRLGKLIVKTIENIPISRRDRSLLVSNFNALVRKDTTFDFSTIKDNSKYAYIQKSSSFSITDFLKNKNLIGSEGYINLFSDKLFQRIFCKDICLAQIGSYNYNSNVNGVDLFMKFNVEYKAGFTGTPKIPKYICDYDLSEVQIDPINPNDLEKINKVLTNKNNKKFVDIKKIKMDGTIKEYVTKIISENSDCNVLIDVGAILIGVTPMDIFKEVSRIRQPTGNFYFVFWDSKDEKVFYDNDGNINPFNEIKYERNNSNTFYYYDNQHTTGTDAQIPSNSKAVVLLGKFSRYRDVVQGIFRMRRLGDENNGEPFHSVRFVVNDEVATHVQSLIGVMDTKIWDNVDNFTSKDLFNTWFNIDEDRINKLQTVVMKNQNLKALLSKEWPYNNDKNIDNVIRNKLRDKHNPFKSYNEFYFPTNLMLEHHPKILMSKQKYDEYENEQIEDFLTNKEGLIEKINQLFPNQFVVVPMATTQEGIEITENVQQQQQQQQKEQEQHQITINQNINIMGQAPPDFDNKEFELITLDDYNKYFIKNQECYKDSYEIGEGYIVSISNNLTKIMESPLFIVKNAKDLFIISYIEGIKLLDYLKNNQRSDISVYDNKTNIYYGNDDYSLSLIIKPLVNNIKFKYNLSYVKYEELSFRDIILLLITSNKQVISIIKNLSLITNGLAPSTHEQIDKEFYNTIAETNVDIHDKENIKFVRRHLFNLLDKVKSDMTKEKCIETFDRNLVDITTEGSTNLTVTIDILIDYITRAFKIITNDMEDCLNDQNEEQFVTD